jgi:hypothetical protein
MDAHAIASLLITILIIGLIFGIALYLVSKIPNAEAQNFARIAVIVVGGVALILFLVSLLPAGGHSLIR